MPPPPSVRDWQRHLLGLAKPHASPPDFARCATAAVAPPSRPPSVALARGRLRLALVIGALQTRDDVALAHMAAFFYRQLCQPSLNLGRNHCLAARHDVA